MGTAGWSVFSYLEVDCFLDTPGDMLRASLGCLTTGLCEVLGEPINSRVLTEKKINLNCSSIKTKLRNIYKVLI